MLMRSDSALASRPLRVTHPPLLQLAVGMSRHFVNELGGRRPFQRGQPPVSTGKNLRLARDRATSLPQVAARP
jgi:hypothetical protein